MNSIPYLSVILPVYNCEKYLQSSIESILTQSFTNFELVIINDGSQDDSDKIIKSFNDKRIKYIKQENQGLSRALNEGIRISRGRFIARQDSDDISLRNRFKKQIEYMMKNPRCSLIGSWGRILKENRLTNKYLIHPTTDGDCTYKLLFDCCFTHTSIMLRRNILEKIGFYNESPNRIPPEDYDLWSRISRNNQVNNIPEVLVYFRENKYSMTYKKPIKIRKNAAKISIENMCYFTKNTEIEEIKNIAGIYHDVDELIAKKPNFYKIEKLLRKIKRNIEQEKKVDIRKSNSKIFIFKIRLKWILNNTIISKFYFIAKPFIKILLDNYLTNIIKNRIKFLK